MTGDPPVLNRSALWAALSAMQIEEPGTGRRFEEALAENQNWTIGFAERVTDEYRRFLYLAATAGFEVTPSQAVDEAWHLHLGYPHYREILCERILCRPLEHRAATDVPGEEERHRRQYEDTAALYERAFLRPPPADIWPPAATVEEWQAAERRHGRHKAATTFAASAAVAAAASAFLGYETAALILFGTALIVMAMSFLLFRPLPGSRNGGSCGGSCGGGGCSGAGSSDASGCGSSCGGGCGGGD